MLCIFSSSGNNMMIFILAWRTTWYTVYPKKYAHGFCFAVLCCGYTLTDYPISIRLTSLALRQSNDCPSASKASLMNMDKYFMWVHYERLHNHNKAKHNKTVCIFLGIYCTWSSTSPLILTFLTFLISLEKARIWCINIWRDNLIRMWSTPMRKRNYLTTAHKQSGVCKCFVPSIMAMEEYAFV